MPGGAEVAIARNGGVEVSDEPPIGRRSTSSSRCRSTPSARATARADFDLARVALAVVDGQREQREALSPSRSRRRCTNPDRRSGGRPLAFGIGSGLRNWMRSGDWIDNRNQLHRIHRNPQSESAIQTPRVVGVQMNLCSCSCRRAARRSASIHSDSVLGSSTPWTGDSRTAATRGARS